jgi:hypothetical protein
MNIAIDKLSVICTDNTYTTELYIDDIFEADDYIEVVSSVFNTNLDRGWTGNLVLKGRGVDCDSLNEVSNSVMTHYIPDALLQNVQLYSICHGEPVAWKYRFLKN